MRNKKLGIFGGTFNPVHYGHLRACEEVREAISLREIIFVPSGNPPLKDRELASAEHRYEMTKLAAESNPFFRISDIECSRQGKSYTVETINTLRQDYKGDDFYLILGIDSFLELPAWHQPERLMELTNFAVMSRPGFSFSSLHSRIEADMSALSELDTGKLQSYQTVLKGSSKVFLLNVTPIGISATGIRRLVKDGMGIKYLLPEAVESYIISNKLYK
jgi:nicotinate-nucleotide adenylyltransferase